MTKLYKDGKRWYVHNSPCENCPSKNENCDGCAKLTAYETLVDEIANRIRYTHDNLVLISEQEKKDFEDGAKRIIQNYQDWPLNWELCSNRESIYSTVYKEITNTILDYIQNTYGYSEFYKVIRKDLARILWQNEKR
jgi:hypothetical protein